MAMEAKTAASALMWFRKGLRIHDNPALVHATASTTHLYPVFVLDPVFLRPDPTLSPPGSSKSALPRIRFLLASLADLDASLRRLGSRLLLLHPSPRDRSVADIVVRVCRDLGVRRLCYEFDAEPYYREMDRSIYDFAVEAGVEVFSPVSHSLFDPRDVIRKNGGRPPLTYQSFIKLVGNPSPPLAHTFSSLPPLGDLADHTVLDSIPTLEELGYTDTCQEDSSHFPGGESEALRRLDSALSDVNWVANFEKPKGDPSAFLKPATTLLSPYLKFGCLSSRYFYQRINDVYENVKKHTSPPVSLVGQLLWRDFFYTVAYGTPNFDQMKGNKICKQIPWNDDDKLLAAWRDGRTGFPWIDAIMIQLHKWGWMHHLARHCVACFLTRGDLFIHWEKGRDVFERLLVDSDWAINNGNWMWLSCSAFFHQYNRIYSPITFGKKYDPSGSYIRHFLPVLKDMPKEYIYEPWTAPLSVQKNANCIIGKDYPNPVVSHEIASKECKRRMGEAYALKRSDVSRENEQKLPSVHKKSTNKLDVSPVKKRTKQKKVV